MNIKILDKFLSSAHVIQALTCLAIVLVAGTLAADPGPWWDVEPEEESPSSHYAS